MTSTEKSNSLATIMYTGEKMSIEKPDWGEILYPCHSLCIAYEDKEVT